MRNISDNLYNEIKLQGSYTDNNGNTVYKTKTLSSAQSFNRKRKTLIYTYQTATTYSNLLI